MELKRCNVRRTRIKSSKIGLEPTTFRDLIGCSHHLATGDSMVSKGQFVDLDWNRNTRLHSQAVTDTYLISNLYNGRQGSLMVSALDFGVSGPGSSPGRGHSVLCS